jgi:hypothetical protein
MGAVLVHGYHPFVEDAAIYVPGIKHRLNPALYPRNAAFFESHARMTGFPRLIAASVRLSHIPLDWALLLWHGLAIFLLLLGCWHLARLAFRDPIAKWGAVSLVAALLTVPVAGTALYVMDQYLNPRSLSTPAVLFMVLAGVERKFVRMALWTAFTALIHPLMVVFGLAYVILLHGMNRVGARENRQQVAARVLAGLLPLGLFPPVTAPYREVLDSHPYFSVLRWQPVEWLGIVLPLATLFWFHRIARREHLPLLDRMCRALILFAVLFFLLALVISIPPQLAGLAELQPMRSLHLLYVILFVFGGGLLAQFVLKKIAWRWIALFLPLCAGMYFAQRQLFPNTRHLELPGMTPRNRWVETFVWIRQNTPIDSYFALDPRHMEADGEDQHGFRAIAERSMLADSVKDSGVVTMFPSLAATWKAQVQAESGWKEFGAADFARLHREQGVNWVVLQDRRLTGLSCPYTNQDLSVCQIE